MTETLPTTSFIGHRLTNGSACLPFLYVLLFKWQCDELPKGHAERGKLCEGKVD